MSDVKSVYIITVDGEIVSTDDDKLLMVSDLLNTIHHDDQWHEVVVVRQLVDEVGMHMKREHAASVSIHYTDSVPLVPMTRHNDSDVVCCLCGSPYLSRKDCPSSNLRPMCSVCSLRWDRQDLSLMLDVLRQGVDIVEVDGSKWVKCDG